MRPSRFGARPSAALVSAAFPSLLARHGVSVSPEATTKPERSLALVDSIQSNNRAVEANGWCGGLRPRYRASCARLFLIWQRQTHSIHASIGWPSLLRTHRQVRRLHQRTAPGAGAPASGGHGPPARHDTPRAPLPRGRSAPGTGACPDEPIACSKPAAAAGGAASIPVLFKQEERLSRITRMISGDR